MPSQGEPNHLAENHSASLTAGTGTEWNLQTLLRVSFMDGGEHLEIRSKPHHTSNCPKWRWENAVCKSVADSPTKLQEGIGDLKKVMLDKYPVVT